MLRILLGLHCGTAQEDRVNCPFYFKIGACRNGDRCNRMHTRPTKGHTLLIPRLYPSIPEARESSNGIPPEGESCKGDSRKPY
eukprot:2523051-Amphidinium_carterae.2